MIPIIIAEIGCNHRGDLATARRMIDVAVKFCEVDAVKFQKRNPRECLSPAEYAAPHQSACHSYGATYGEHREALEFSVGEHVSLRESCREAGVEYSASVWDVTSAREMIPLCDRWIKVPSALNRNRPLLDVLTAEYPGQIHVSLGMTTRREEVDLVEYFAGRERLSDLVLYACVSGYPVAVPDLALLEIDRLCSAYREIAGVGFSGHHTGIAADSAAVALGARYIERHFTLDRTWRGTDHAASLEPDGLRRVARDCRAVERALRLKSREIEDVEVEQRRKLKEGRIAW